MNNVLNNISNETITNIKIYIGDVFENNGIKYRVVGKDISDGFVLCMVYEGIWIINSVRCISMCETILHTYKYLGKAKNSIDCLFEVIG